MIVTDDDAIAEVCRSMRNQGRNEKSDWLDHARLGFNYRLSDIHAALGLAQLERLEELLSQRQLVAESYDKQLHGIPGLVTPKQMPGGKRSWFVYVVQLPSNAGPEVRDEVLRLLRASGIGCQAYFPAIHRQPYMKGRRASTTIYLRPEVLVALQRFSAATDVPMAYYLRVAVDDLLAKHGVKVPKPRVGGEKP